jgi:hypothetical protein
MAFEATFRHGEPVMIDYTPGAGNIPAGQVILLGNTAGLTCGIAHSDIPNNVQGALGSGGGVYEVTNLNNAANYSKVYWDDTNNKATTVSTNNAQLGFVVRDGGRGANTTCFVRHWPFV